MKEAIERLVEEMAREGYVADRAIATSVHLARAMEKPLLVEGDAGVGKTEIAKVMARVLDTELIRLQCYEGLDVHTALYEWNYQKQLLRIRMREVGDASGEGDEEAPRGDTVARADAPAGTGGRDAGADAAADADVDLPEASGADAAGRGLEETIFDRDYLLERPLLKAITRDERPVLLIDEIDRADEEFEAFLLELLSDFQVTIPELGTVAATHRPHVVLTSNSTRELSDALRRRCLYLWIDHPSFEKELRILRLRMPELADRLGEEVVRTVHRLREEKLYKTPGIAETLDWAEAVRELGVESLDPETVRATLGCLLKDRHDLERIRGDGLGEILEEALAGEPAGASGARDE